MEERVSPDRAGAAGRGGRPTVEDRLGDPAVASKALELRNRGFSWAQIARRLNVGRTTARRLCQKASGGSGVTVRADEGKETIPVDPPFRNGAQSVPNALGAGGHDVFKQDATDEDSEEGVDMPETFRLFSDLLRRAAEGHAKAR